MITNSQLKTLIEAKEYDLAIQYSVQHNSTMNMQMVLKAYGMPCGWDAAEQALIALSVEF